MGTKKTAGGIRTGKRPISAGYAGFDGAKPKPKTRRSRRSKSGADRG